MWKLKYITHKKLNGRYSWAVLLFYGEALFSCGHFRSTTDFETRKECDEDCNTNLSRLNLPLPKTDPELQSEFKYYVVIDKDGPWIMTEHPWTNDTTIELATNDKTEAETCLCRLINAGE